MEDPVLYQQSNRPVREDGKRIFEEFVDIIQLRPDGKDALIDIGCGPGDVLMDFIRPILPKNYRKIVGTDISPKMIEYARKQYADYDKVQFDVLDIVAERLPLEYHKGFDHVTSFYCLHWIQDQRRALQNIFDLLTPGGDCIIVFLGSHSIFEGYQYVAQDPQWKDYMFDLKNIVPVSQRLEDLRTFYTNLFKEVGFVSENIEIRQKASVHQGYEAFRDFFASVNPFVRRMSIAVKKDYIRELSTFYEKTGLVVNGTYVTPHRLVVAYARRPRAP